MKITPYLILLVFSLQLTACAHYYANRDDLATMVDNWLEEREYGRALETLSRVKPSHPDYQRLEAMYSRTLREAEGFEQSVVTRAQSLYLQQEWLQAKEVYDEGLAKLPNSQTITNARNEFLQKREIELKGHRQSLLISTAEYLAESTPILQQINQLTNDDVEAGRALAQNQQQMQPTIQGLNECGWEAMEQKDYPLAEKCFGLMSALDSNIDISRPLEKIKQAQEDIERHKTQELQTQISKEKSRKTKETYNLYYKAIEQGNLAEAQKYVNQLNRLRPNDNKVLELRQELQNFIDRKVAQGIEQGRELYSQGKVQQALDIWKPLLSLAPDNGELKGDVERAERVIDNLRELSKEREDQ